MGPMKLRAGKLWKEVALLVWAVVLAFLLSLILFGAMLAAAYVVDEYYSPSLNESSYPSPRNHN
jgi:hypothetical protein